MIHVRFSLKNTGKIISLYNYENILWQNIVSVTSAQARQVSNVGYYCMLWYWTPAMFWCCRSRIHCRCLAVSLSIKTFTSRAWSSSTSVINNNRNRHNDVIAVSRGQCFCLQQIGPVLLCIPLLWVLHVKPDHRETLLVFFSRRH